MCVCVSVCVCVCVSKQSNYGGGLLVTQAPNRQAKMCVWGGGGLRILKIVFVCGFLLMIFALRMAVKGGR